ncbi:TorF family putative porin [Pusillimonas sp. SM2304]|uniref:TorF family putative porin n=1 Tax=Pusillimonas sp. SM2304 TaxID=3073241 RepID=UPI0038F6A588
MGNRLATGGICALMLGAAACAPAYAQDAGAAQASDFTLSANMSLVSQYRYRGIMQTNNKPAIQGGFDLVHASGFYIGNWNSSISWLDDSDPDVSAAVEMDFYAGYAGTLWKDLTFDVGILEYYYPGSYPGGYTRPYTTEAYLGLGYGPIAFKYSHAFTNLFGVPDSKNSQYYDLSASFETGVWGTTLDAHVGYQKVRNLDDGSYTDWSLGLSKDWGQGFSTTLAYIDTNADRNVYSNTKGRYTGRATALLSLNKTF